MGSHVTRPTITLCFTLFCFPPSVASLKHGAGGHAIPVVALLPLLHHDLEEFAADDPVASHTGRTEAKV